MNQLKASALRPIIEKVYTAPSKEVGLDALTTFLNAPDCPIRANEKAAMLARARACPTLIGLQQYLTNSWFFYEGMSCDKQKRF